MEQKGEIVAFNGYLPRKIKVGDKSVWSLQSFDTVTSPDCRGQGLFGLLQDLIYKEVAKRGIPWIYGWTSEIGFKVFTGKMGWKIWGQQHYLMRILNPQWFMQEKFKNSFLANCAALAMDNYFRPAPVSPAWNGKITEESNFPQQTTCLCREWANNFELIAIRDREYLNWRLSNPLTKQRLFCAYDENKEYKENKMSAYAVIHISDDKIMDISDCAWLCKNTWAALLAHLEQLARDEKCNIIRFRVSKDKRTQKIFKKAGYFYSRTKFPMLGHCISCDPSLQQFLWNKDKTIFWSYFDRNE